MNRSIETRLKRLEDASGPVESPCRRSHVIPLDLEPGQDREAAAAAARAELVARGEVGPDDFIWWSCELEADADTKRAWHDMFRRIAEERGHKPEWVYHQYLDKFGEAPPSDG